MYHLMMKDLYTQKKIAYFTSIILTPYFLSLEKNLINSSLFLNILCSLSIAFFAYFMTMYSNFNTGEGDKLQNSLLLSLPIVRRSVIDAKYALISIWWLFSYVSFIIILIILRTFFHFSNNLSVDFTSTLLSLCFTYLLAAIYYPIHFKFGYRAASMVGVVLFFVLSSIAGKLFSIGSGFGSFIAAQPVLSVAVITLILTLLSYLLSVQIYEKKDY